jgi:hypothetical protein
MPQELRQIRRYPNLLPPAPQDPGPPLLCGIAFLAQQIVKVDLRDIFDRCLSLVAAVSR